MFESTFEPVSKAIKLCVAAAAIVLTGNVHAGPVDVTYTVSGSPGNWLYDFSFTNNIGGANYIYGVGVRLNVLNNSPAYPNGWSIGNPGGINWFNSGGSNTDYNNTWGTCLTASCPAGHPPSDIDPGQTLSGFQVLDTGQIALTNVSWYANAFGDVYSGPGCSFTCAAQFRNPGFEGLASISTQTAVPEPGSLALLLLGLGAVCCWTTRRKILPAIAIGLA